MKAAVLGSGGWGTALAMVLAANGHDTALLCRSAENAERIRSSRQNPHLKGVLLPRELRITANGAEALDGADLGVFASPSQYMRPMLEKLLPFTGKGTLLVNVAKGIERNTLLRMEELFLSLAGDRPYAVLSGPSHAEEVARNLPAALVTAARRPEWAEKVRQGFMNPRFRVYTTDDVTGVELGGSLKNVMAIAAGIADGMGLGDNTKAALITRGIAEMSRLGAALGGQRETFAGLSGIGDMIVTCTSRHSRNRFVGESLGRGKTLDETLREMNGNVAEGVTTAVSADDLAHRAGVETPVIQAVRGILYRGLPPEEVLDRLMTRSHRDERD